MSAYSGLLLAAVLGWLVGWLVGRGKRADLSVFRGAWTAPAIIVLFCCALVEISAHAVEAAVAWGMFGTLPWYAAPALPWLLVILAASALGWRHTPLGYSIALIMPVFFVLVEFFGEFGQMVATYSQEPLSLAALHRLETLHPAWLGLPTLAAATLLAAALLATAFALCVVAIRHRQEA
jgi:hypothetical protein